MFNPTKIWERMMGKKERIMNMMWELPNDTMACTSFGFDIYKLVIFIIKHITIQTVTTSLAINASVNAIALASAALNTIKGFFQFDFWAMGHGGGEILYLLF